MTINDINITLKDGRKAVIRNACDEDIPGMLEYLYKSAGETDFILRYPEECSRYTPELEKKVFADMNASPNGAMLVCIVEGKLAGNCQITWSNKMKTCHRASIGIALLKEYWNLGIGTKLLEALIRIAEDNKIMQMELQFIEGNSRARALYEKMGFKIVSMLPNAIRSKDGTLLNEYTMIRKIENNW